MTSDQADAEFLAAFERGRLDPGAFDHAAHIRAAFLLLREADFLDAARRYGRAVQALAEKAGAPEKFNVTITLAFLALIAERMSGETSAYALMAKHPDLLDRHALSAWYPEPARLAEGRTSFRLPAIPTA